MSQRYKGAVISATPPTTSTSAAPGAWTLQQQMQAQGAGTWPFGGPFNYIEDVFSTYLYTGNASTQTITNGIDLSTKGGLVWLKNRGAAASNALFDTQRGVNKLLISNSTNAEFTGASAYGVTAFNSNGFSFQVANPSWNDSTNTYASWTFRKQDKFFDVVTYTGNGTSGRQISHSLGSVPGCIIVKITSTTESWVVYHQSLGATKGLILNGTNAVITDSSWWNDTAPTSTAFTVGNSIVTNVNGATYVAYIFAHNAGGFGLTGSDNVISCGSFTTSGTAPENATVNLGYEPQFLLYKISSSTGDWRIVDNMRGFTASGASTTSPQLRPNLSNAEQNNSFVQLTSTGFTTDTGVDAQTYIYVAIRRGPMKTPTTATSVFAPTTYTGTGATNQTITTNFPVDIFINCDRTNSANMSSYTFPLFTRMLSLDNALTTAFTNAWDGGWGNSYWRNDSNTGIVAVGTGGQSYNNQSGVTYVNYNFGRAPGFMDAIIYTGTGVNTTFGHKLGVVPELMIVKSRNALNNWAVYLGGPLGGTKTANLNRTYAAYDSSGHWNNTQPTASVFSIGNNGEVNNSGTTYINYLFASCPGVSKVGSYTGTGSTQTISCGFAARFVMIKRTDSTSNWWFWDTSRGMVAGTDPRMAFNVSAAETNENWVYTNASGFQIVTSDATVNASGGTYIYLAIA